MVGPCGASPSHGRAAGCVHAQGPPDGAVASPVAGEEAHEERGGALPPGGADGDARRPPGRDRGGPTAERAPAAPAGATGFRPTMSAFHALAGVDRVVVDAVADGAGDGVEPGGEDHAEPVEVAGDHARRENGAAPPALPTAEASLPDLGDGDVITVRDHDLPTPRAVAPEDQGARGTRGRPAVRTSRRPHAVNRWRLAVPWSRKHVAPSRDEGVRVGPEEDRWELEHPGTTHAHAGVA